MCAWALATLQSNPPRRLIASLLQLCRVQLRRLDSQQLVHLFWAVARFQHCWTHVPDQHWMHDFKVACDIQQQRFTAQGLCMLLWSLSQIGFPVGVYKDWCQSLQRQLEAHDRLQPVDAVMCLTAVASLGHDQTVPGFVEHCIMQLSGDVAWQSVGPHDLPAVIGALARIGYRPGSQWLDQYLRTCQRHMSVFSHQELSMVLWGLAKLKVWNAGGELFCCLQVHRVSSWFCGSMQAQLLHHRSL